MTAAKRIQCLDRALDILERVAEAGELGTSQLAQRLGLHVATVHNLLRTLASRNYLANVAGRYRIGFAAGCLSAKWDPVAVLPRLARPHIERMSARTGEAGCIAVFVGQQVQLIQVSRASAEVAAQFPAQAWDRPLHLATGRLLFALRPEHLWDEFIQRNMAGGERSADERAWRMEDWRAELRKIRAEQRFAKVRKGAGATSSVAAPVWGPKGEPLAAVGGSCPSFRATRALMRAMLEAACEAARDITTELGGRPPGPRGKFRRVQGRPRLSPQPRR